MKNKDSGLAGALFLLMFPDEMRQPYESVLSPLGSEIVWHQTLDALLTAAGQSSPSVAIIDLDCLGADLELPLERLRASFGSTDLIALSSVDSAQLAMQCLRAGFVDFLVKPVSPEELAWGIRKCQQRQEFVNRIGNPKKGIVRAITQISGCTTPTLVHVYALEYLVSLFGSAGAAWVKVERQGADTVKILCSLPKRVASSEILFEVPTEKLSLSKKFPLILSHKIKGTRKVIFRCRSNPNHYLFLWGIKERVTAQKLSSGALIIEHSEMSILNLQKFSDIKKQAFIDDLTGLYNSRYLKFAITNAIVKCKKPKQSFSLLFIDVDHFKNVNDSFGHIVGSDFLVAIGRTIKNAVRNIDPVFRYGGDEFVVLLNETNIDGAKEIAERIRKNIERRVFLIKGKRIQTTVSIGIATCPEHAAERETLLKLADEAMYGAKRKARNAVHLAPIPPRNQ